MVQTDLIDDHVSLNQCQLAVDALLKHEQRRQEKLQETQLLPGKEQNVWLVLTVKQMHPERKLKPHKIPIVHPLVDPRTSGICLITKDPQREYKDLLEEHKIKFISRVVGIEKLKGKWKPFEARRLLLKENDLFLTDERVVPLLPKLLGKKFFDAKKQPIPVNLTRKDLKGELERAISSTYFHQNQGTCASIKVGTLSQTPSQVLANLKSALPAVVKAVKGGWENVQSLNIKTNTSTSLPIWSCDLGAESGGRWDGLVDIAMSEDAEEGEEGESEEEEAVKPKKSEKGKKRAAEDDEEVQPKKKTKASSVSEPVPVEEPKSKKHKTNVSQVTPSDPSPAVDKPSASVPSDGDLKTKKKKRKAPASTSDSTLVASSASQDVSEPPVNSDKPTIPLTPSVNKKTKKSRAKATDFFDDTAATNTTTPASTRIAPPPPNTPADGLVAAAAQTPANPKKKKKSKKGDEVEVAQTPVSRAIEKLADEVQVVTAPPSSSEDAPDPTAAETAKEGDGTKPARKPRHKKNKATGVADTASSSTVATTDAEPALPPSHSETPAPAVPASAPGDGEKKKKKRKKEVQGDDGAASTAAVGAGPGASSDSIPAVTVSDVKQKLGATSGVEKKKEKAIKAKRSAKEGVLGKRSV